MRKTTFFLVPLFLTTALALPLVAWSSPQEIRQLMAQLKKAKEGYFSPEAGELRWKMEGEFAKAPPGPGWEDWYDTRFPSFVQVDDLIDMLEAADVLGLIDRTDSTARQVTWEIAGGIRDLTREDGLWLRTTRQWLRKSAPLPETAALLKHIDTRGRELRVLLKRAKTVLQAEASASRPPPRGRPLLAEGSEAYRRLMRDSETVLQRARRLETLHGAAIPRDWPYRVEFTRQWARLLADRVGLFHAAALSGKSPRNVLEYAESITHNTGISFDGIDRLTCACGQGPCPKIEQPVADELRKIANAFFDSVFDSNYDLDAQLKKWLGKEP